jgi:hypothetical protein
MYEVPDGYIFTTFQDGKVIFYRDSYKKHCEYRNVIRGIEGRENIQKALIFPHIITTYPFRDASGRVVANCKKYRTIANRERVKTSRGNEWEYWEVILRKNISGRKKIVSAYITYSPEPFVVNDRIEKIIFSRRIR